MNHALHTVLLYLIVVSSASILDTKNSDSLNDNVDFISYTQPIPNSNESIDLIPVHGGAFDMGPFENGDLYRVTIDSFWIGKFEVTWDQYDLFLKESLDQLNLSGTPLKAEPMKADAISLPSPPYVDMSFGMGRDGFPAISMTHYAAVMFTKWLYAKTGFFFRLPTEAEWEYACKLNHQDYNELISSEDLNNYAWYKENSNRKYQKVGTKNSSNDGVYDLLGNVSEWTLDQYKLDYNEAFRLGKINNPFIKPKTLYPRSVRGGSWMDDSNELACTQRRASNERWQRRDPQLPKSLWWLTDAPFVGFRVVRPLKTPEQQEMQQYWIEAMEAY